MKPFYIFTVLFFLTGIFSVDAQDLIFLRNGKIIEAKVIEISQEKIRHRSFANPNGPVMAIQADSVLSIRYENGAVDVINAIIQDEKPEVTTALNPDKTTFGMNTNIGSSLMYGTSLRFDFSKGNLNTEISLIFPSLGLLDSFDYPDDGFGILATFNYFSHKQNGGFYLGGGIGFIYYSVIEKDINMNPMIYTIGLNVGYKFVTKSGIYFRTGSYIGLGACNNSYEEYNEEDKDYRYVNDYWTMPCIIPDLSIGFCFK